MNAEYTEYLQSEHWMGLRSSALAIAGGQCEHCRDRHRLDCHHITYRNPLTLCTVEDLMILCRKCHDTWHDWRRGPARNVHFAFNRDSTIGALIVLSHRAEKAKRKKAKRVASGELRNTMQSEMMADPMFLALLAEKLPRHLFRKRCREMYVGKSRAKRISNALALFKRESPPHPQRSA